MAKRRNGGCARTEETPSDWREAGGGGARGGGGPGVEGVIEHRSSACVARRPGAAPCERVRRHAGAYADVVLGGRTGRARRRTRPPEGRTREGRAGRGDATDADAAEA